MPRIPGTTDRQSAFLRAFVNSPNGPSPSDWPSPARLRSWLRRPSFRSAFLSLQQTLHVQADFHLAATAATLAQSLLNNPSLTTRDIQSLLKLSHVRQRFTSPPSTNPDPSPSSPPDSKSSQSPIPSSLPPTPTTPPTPPAPVSPEPPPYTPEKGGRFILDLPIDFFYAPKYPHPDSFQAKQLLLAPVARALNFFPPVNPLPSPPETPPSPEDAPWYHILHNTNSLLKYMQEFKDPSGRESRYAHILVQLYPRQPNAQLVAHLHYPKNLPKPPTS